MPVARALFATCADWLSGADVPGILREAGFAVTVLAPPGFWAARGSGAGEWRPLPVKAAAAAEALRRHLDAHPRYDWILAGDDALLRALVGRRTEPWVRAVLPLDPDGPDVDLIGSKVGLARTFARHGIATPRTRIVAELDEAVAAGDAIGYPVLLKIDRSSGGRGTFLARDRAGLVTAFPARGGALVVQELVDGPIWSAEALFDRGRPLACATSRIEVAWPRPYGPSAVRRYRAAPALDELACGAGAALGVHGFANISAVEERATGRFLLFELDPRVNPALRSAARAQVDFVAAARALGARRAVALHVPAGVDVSVRLYPQDAVRCVEEPDLAGLATALLGRGRPRAAPALERAYLAHIARSAAARYLPARLVSVAGWLRRLLLR